MVKMTLEEAHAWIREMDIGVWHNPNSGWEEITGQKRAWYLEYGPIDGCYAEHFDFLEACTLLKEMMVKNG